MLLPLFNAEITFRLRGYIWNPVVYGYNLTIVSELSSCYHEITEFYVATDMKYKISIKYHFHIQYFVSEILVSKSV